MLVLDAIHLLSNGIGISGGNDMLSQVKIARTTIIDSSTVEEEIDTSQLKETIRYNINPCDLRCTLSRDESIILQS